jgi:hypothetical protein
VGDDIHSGVVGVMSSCGDVECRKLIDPIIYLGCENVGARGVAKSAVNVGKVTGGSEVKHQSDASQFVPVENVAMANSHHAQLTHAQQPSTLRQWKRSARRGGVNVP